MSDKSNKISLQEYDSPRCIACRKKLHLADTQTFMCSKCNNYFCEDCALYHNNLAKTNQHDCPGYFGKVSEKHSPSLVKIIKNMTGPDLLGVSIKNLQVKIKDESSKPNIKIIEESKENSSSVSSKKSSLKILDNGESIQRPIKKEVSTKRSPVIIEDEDDSEG